jgi:hypothetical protein
VFTPIGRPQITARGSLPLPSSSPNQSRSLPEGRRNLAFGLFYTGYGVWSLIGSVATGLLYEYSRAALVVFAVAVELASLPIFVWRLGSVFAERERTETAGVNEESQKEERPMKIKKKSDQPPGKSVPSESDLGQKEAELEKASEEELRHMGDAKAAQAARKQKEKKKSK